MSKTIKWILISIAGIVVAVIISVYLILASYDFNSLKPAVASAVKEATGRNLEIGGDIEVSPGLIPSLVVSDVNFENASWGSRPKLATIKRLEVQVSLLPLLKKNIEVKRFILMEPDILVETNRNGKLNLVLDKTSASEEKKKQEEKTEEGPMTLPALSMEEFVIENGTFTYKAFDSEETHTARINRLEAVSEGMDSPVRASLDAVYNKAPIRLDAQLGSPSAALDPEKDWALNLKINALGIESDVKGKIRDLMTFSGIQAAVNAKIENLTELNPSLQPLLKMEIPPVAPVHFEANVKDTGKMAYTVSGIDLNFAGNDISGEANVDLSAKTPLIKADLASRKMDLNSIVNGAEKDRDETAKPAGTEKAPAGEGGKKSGKVFPDEPLPLHLLKIVDADIGYKARDFILPEIAMHQLNLGVRLRNGNLAVSPLKAELGGGSLNGSATLSLASENTAAAKAKITTTGFDLGAMLKELQITELMSGRVNMDLDLAAAGGSVSSLMAGLDGYSKIIMENGAVHNKFVGLVGAELDKAIAQLLIPGQNKKDSTAINCFVNRFDFKNGVAETTVLFMDSEYMTVTGEGRVDLGKETLDIALLPRPKENIADVGMSIGQLASNFKIGGTLKNPRINLDAAGAVKTVEKALGGISDKGSFLGVLSALEGKTAGREDLCPAAKEAANSGRKMRFEKTEPRQEETAPASTSSPEEQKSMKKELKRKQDIENIGDALKGIFGN